MLKQARTKLAGLEQAAWDPRQPDLFAAPATSAPPADALPEGHAAVLETLRDTDVDTLSPRDALNLLYSLRERLDAPE